MRLLISALLLLTLAVSACTDGPADDERPIATEPASPPAASGTTSGIRTVDFGNTTWFLRWDASPDLPREFTLSGGEGSAPGDVDAVSVRVTGTPLYTDIDRDGAEDAAVRIALTSGNGYYQAWYAWLWRDGAAQQIRRPLVSEARCGNAIDSVRPAAGGLDVRARLRDPNDACATRAPVRVSYRVTVAGDLPVRTSADGPLPAEPCDASLHVRGLTPNADTVPRLAPDPAAPAVAAGTSFTQARLSEVFQTTENGTDWSLALLTTTDGREVCGWLPT